MAHEGTSTLISMEFAQESRGASSFHWWMAGSAVFHVFFAFIALTVQFSSSDPLLVSTFDVALVTLSEPLSAKKGEPAPRSSTADPQSVFPQPAQQEPREPMPEPLPITPQRERLSESLAGAVSSIQVPQARTSSPVLIPDHGVDSPSPSQPVAASAQPTVLTDIELPDVPKLKPVQPLTNKELGTIEKPAPQPLPTIKTEEASSREPSAPTSQPQPAPRASTEVNELLRRIPSIPEAPTLKAVQPLSPENRSVPSQEPSDPLSPSIEGLVASIPVPTQRSTRIIKKPATTITPNPPRPERAPSVPLPKTPELARIPDPAKGTTSPSKHEQKIKQPRRLTESLQEVLGNVKIPDIRTLSDAMPRPASTDPVSPALDETRRKAREAIAQIPVPDFTSSDDNAAEDARTKAKQALERIQIPDLAVPPSAKTRHAPTGMPSPDPAMVRKKTQEAIEGIKIPDVTAMTRSPKRHSPTTRIKPEPLRSEIDTQLEKLKIPDVLPAESIRSRLRVQAVALPGEKGQRSSDSGTASKGSAAPIQNQYLARVRAMVDRHWVAPTLSVSEKHLETIVAFRILRSGEIVRLHVEKGSQHAYYDAAALRAVQAVDPLPPLPKELDVSYLDVHFRFALGK